MGEVGPADIDANVGHASNQAGVGNDADRSAVQNDIIEMTTQQGKCLVQRLAGHQFRRIWGDGSAGQHVEIGRAGNGLAKRQQIGRRGGGKILGDAGSLVGQRKQAVQRRLADIHAHDERLALHQGKADGQVGGSEALAFAGCGRGEEYDFLAFLQHILQVGAHVSEYFFHQAVLVFRDDDGSGFRFFHVRDIAYDGHVGNAFDVGAALNLEAQQAGQIDAAQGYGQSQDEGHQVDVPTVGRGQCLHAGFFHDAAVVGRGSQGDGILLAFLEEHQVEVGLDFLLTGDGDQFAFLLGRAADAALVFPGFQVEVVAGDLQGFLHAFHRSQHRAAGGGNGSVEIDHSRVALVRGAQQAFALDKHLVVLRNDVDQAVVRQAHIGRDNLVAVVRIFNISAEESHETQLRVVFRPFLVVLATALESQLGIGAQVGQSGPLLIIRQFAFRRAQFFIDDADALVDKLSRAAGHLVFVFVGIVVVERDQGIEHVHAPADVGIVV